MQTSHLSISIHSNSVGSSNISNSPTKYLKKWSEVITVDVKCSQIDSIEHGRRWSVSLCIDPIHRTNKFELAKRSCVSKRWTKGLIFIFFTFFSLLKTSVWIDLILIVLVKLTVQCTFSSCLPWNGCFNFHLKVRLVIIIVLLLSLFLCRILLFTLYLFLKCFLMNSTVRPLIILFSLFLKLVKLLVMQKKKKEVMPKGFGATLRTIGRTDGKSDSTTPFDFIRKGFFLWLWSSAMNNYCKCERERPPFWSRLKKRIR